MTQLSRQDIQWATAMIKRGLSNKPTMRVKALKMLMKKNKKYVNRSGR
jgi:hypothetical protein